MENVLDKYGLSILCIGFTIVETCTCRVVCVSLSILCIGFPGKLLLVTNEPGKEVAFNSLYWIQGIVERDGPVLVLDIDFQFFVLDSS